MKKNLQILMLIAIFSIIGGILQAQVDPPCNPVTNVETSNITSYSAKITGKIGLSDKRVITQGGDDLNDGVLMNIASLVLAHRYTTAELAPYDGGYLTKFRLFLLIKITLSFNSSGADFYGKHLIKEQMLCIKMFLP